MVEDVFLCTKPFTQLHSYNHTCLSYCPVEVTTVVSAVQAVSPSAVTLPQYPEVPSFVQTCRWLMRRFSCTTLVSVDLRRGHTEPCCSVQELQLEVFLSLWSHFHAISSPWLQKKVLNKVLLCFHSDLYVQSEFPTSHVDDSGNKFCPEKSLCSCPDQQHLINFS